MRHYQRDVVKGAFDWFGLDVDVHNELFHMTRGRIGQLQNPLRIENNEIRGGWYVPDVIHKLSPDTTQVDIVLKDETTYVMFRSDDPQEICPAEYELLMSIAWREGDVWCTVTPRRDYGDETNPSRRTNYHFS